MAIFISYAREDAGEVEPLRRDIEDFLGPVWSDRRLDGGQDWWDEILEQIRSCSLFVLALSPRSARSEACRSESDYAAALDRPLLPVMVAPTDLDLAPSVVDRRHVVEYLDRTPDTVLLLTRALARVPEAGPLPEELPEPPPLPVSYAQTYRRRLAAPSLTLDEQVQLFAVLKLHLASPDRRDDSLRLIAELRGRPDITIVVAAEIDDLLASSAATAPDDGTCAPPPRPPKQAAKRPTKRASTPVGEPPPLTEAPARPSYTIQVTNRSRNAAKLDLTDRDKRWTVEIRLGSFTDLVLLDGKEVARFGFTEAGTSGGGGYWKRAEFTLKAKPSRKVRLDFNQSSWGKLLAWQLGIDGEVVHKDGTFTPPSE